jgi:hypothetical protein
VEDHSRPQLQDQQKQEEKKPNPKNPKNRPMTIEKH